MLACDRVLEKCFWAPGKVPEFCVTRRMGTLMNGLEFKMLITMPVLFIPDALQRR